MDDAELLGPQAIRSSSHAPVVDLVDRDRDHDENPRGHELVRLAFFDSPKTAQVELDHVDVHRDRRNRQKSREGERKGREGKPA
jgi:hypothetical protein